LALAAIANVADGSRAEMRCETSIAMGEILAVVSVGND
jgi:hypothetical protein